MAIFKWQGMTESRHFAGMKQRLQAQGIAFDGCQVPGGGLWRIFVNDPNGVMIELDHEAAKEAFKEAVKEAAKEQG
jgi:hypothetical protein